MTETVRAGIRLDKWLHHVRVFKTRTLATERIEAGGIRVNGQPCRKPSRQVQPGDEVVVSYAGQVRTLRVLGLGERRGPASEASGLYQEILPDARLE